MKYEKLDARVASQTTREEWDSWPEPMRQMFVRMAMATLEAQDEKEELKKRADDAEKELEVLKKQEADDLRRRRGLVIPMDSIGVSRSLLKVRMTEEWKDAQMGLEDSLSGGLISQEDYDDQMKAVERDLLRTQEAKYRKELRRRTVQTVGTVQEHIRKWTRHGYMWTTVDPEMLYEEETALLQDEEGRVPLGALIVPSKGLIEEHVTFMIDDLRAKAAQDTKMAPLRGNHVVTVEVNLFFTASNRHPSYTRNMIITIPEGAFKEDWYETFKQAALDKYAVFTDPERYEELEEACLMPKVSIHVILSQFDDVTQWFDDVAAGEKTRDMHDFRLLLCADKDKPCEQQAAEFFNRVYDPSKTLRENLEKPCTLTHSPTRMRKDGSPFIHTHTAKCQNTYKVVLYTPLHKDIRHIRSIDDLTRNDDELVETTDCKTVARLMVHKGHVGVITRIFTSKRKRPSATNATRVIERSPFKVDSGSSRDNDHDRETVQIFLDFETFRQCTFSENSPDLAVPFLVCWSEMDSGAVETLHSEHVVRDFVDRILDTYEGKTVVLWAWNGSGFDHHLLLGEFKNRMPDDEDIKQRDNRILMVTFRYGETYVMLKDPMLFIPSSLANAARDFGVLNKGDFPHDVVSDRSCLTEVIQKWYILKNKTVETVVGDCCKIMLVTAKSYKEIVDHNNTLTVLEKAIEYCKIDVLAMKQIWAKFLQDMWSSLNICVPLSIMTLPQLAFGVLVSKLPKGVQLHVPTGDEYEFIRKAQFGGRVMAKNGVFNEECIYVDVVSEYPSVMWLYDHPYGPSVEVKEIDWDKLGIYDVTLVFSPCMTHVYMETCMGCIAAKDRYTEFLPRRDPEDGRLKHSLLLEQRGTWCTYDLEIALDDGYVVQEVHSGIEWAYKGKIFKQFIDTVKHIKENAASPSERQVGKIVMNSSYGKLNQKPIDGETFIVPRGTAFQFLDDLRQVNGEIQVAGSTIKMPVFQELDENWEKMTIETEGENRHPAQNGVFVLAGARKFLRDHLMSIRKYAPNVKVIYSDTDSMIIPVSSLEGYDPSPHFGKELGKLDDTVVKGFSGVRLNRVVVAGKKMYAYEYSCPKTGKTVGEIHMKGVPNKMLSMTQLDHLLQGNDRRVRYAMMLMKKNLVTVQMMDIVKEVGCITGSGSRKATQRCIENKCSCDLPSAEFERIL